MQLCSGLEPLSVSSFREKIIVKAMNDNDDILSPYLSRVDKADGRFFTAKLSPFSRLIQRTVLKEAFEKPTAYLRNRHILDTTTTLYKLLPKKLAHMFFCFDDDINVKAKECADYCRRVAIDPKAIEFIRLHHNLSVNDDVLINEGVPVNGDVPINEGVLVNEYPAVDTEPDRIVTETITGRDQAIPESDRTLTETISGSDQASPEFDRTITETISGSDQTNPESDLAITETSSGSDPANPEFNRAITETISGSGLANPESDRTLTETISGSDQVSPEFNQAITETSSGSDLANPEFNRAITETISGRDLANPEFNQAITETSSGSDLANPEFNRAITETISGSGLANPEFNRAITETISGSGLANPEFDQTIPETSSGSDLANPALDLTIPENSPEIDRISSVNSIGELPTDKQNVAYEYLSRYVATFNIQPIKPSKAGKLSGCIKRYTDNRWWLRKFRKLITQANEKAAIHLNFVNSKRQVYASNITTKNRIAQRLRNDELMSSSFIINELGQRYSLKEVSDLNVSNPKIRKDELICRARGFENLAKEEGHEALFITITCPSKYHRAFSKSGAPNPKWQGLMPDEANGYLNHQWQKTRAEFNRQNINPYGFRVVEPQHDGTPHWHMLFFIEGEKLETMQNIIRQYALEIDGDEKGALENRCDFKKIDPAKGSATGYILKYIVKNIDGEGLGEDKFGNDSLLVAQRIDAWASCWCIRQFQQIGGASVSVWRELRRIRTKLFKTDSENQSSVLEQARFAADNSDWQDYTTAMGGVLTKLKDRPIKLHYELNVDEETGECLQSYYDGELITKIKGLWFAGKTIVTRLYRWRIEKA